MRLLLVSSYCKTAGPELYPFLMESVSRLTVTSNENFALSVIGDPAQYDIILMEYVERNATWLSTGLADRPETEDGEEEGEWDEGEWD